MADQLNYPRAKVAVEGGELQDVFDANLTFTDNSKPVHTFRGKGKVSGIFRGPKSAKLSFSSSISHEGFERDYLGKWDRDETIECRFKMPGGKVCVIKGMWTEPSIKSSNDSQVDFSISIVGEYSFSG